MTPQPSIRTLTNQPETRSLAIKSLEIRAAPEGSKSPGTLEGIAVPYNQWADIGGWFREQFDPKAFSIPQPENQFAYRNHNWDEPLGSTVAGNLKFYDSPEGMRFKLDLIDTQDARDLALKVEKRIIAGASIGFRVKANEWRFAEDAKSLDERTITEAEILEVSLTHMPAYSGTSAAMRGGARLDESRDVHTAAKQQRETELAAREREAWILTHLPSPNRS